LRISLCFALFLFSACEGPETCIDAEDFGNIKKDRIVVYPFYSILLNNPEDKECDKINPGDSKSKSELMSSYQAICGQNCDPKLKVLKYCLLGYADYHRTTVGNAHSESDANNTIAKRDDEGCYTKTNQNQIDCEYQCINACKQVKDMPNWTATSPSTETLKGIDIEPRTMISIKVKGEVSLGEENPDQVPLTYDKSAFKPNFTPNASISVEKGYNLKILQNSLSNSEVYSFANETILLNRRSDVWLSDVGTCSVDYLLSSSSEEDPKCPIKKTSTNGFLNKDEPMMVETGTITGDTIKNENKTEDYYLVLEHPSSSGCSLNFQVEDNENPSEIHINYSNYNVPNAFDLYPENNKLITLYSDSKLNITSRTGCSTISFKKMKFVDININQSGFLEIKNVYTPTASSQACVLKSRIINPAGKKCIKANLDDCNTEAGVIFDGSSNTRASGSGISHFYEYSDYFDTTSPDPTGNITITDSFSSSNIFVRKEQKIRILPETFRANIQFIHNATYNKKCGYGMFFKIIPRPALMCFSTANNVTVRNPSCNVDLALYAPIPEFTKDPTGENWIATQSATSQSCSNPEAKINNCQCMSSKRETCSNELEKRKSLKKKIDPTFVHNAKYCIYPYKCAKVTCTYNQSTGDVESCTKPSADSECSNTHSPNTPPACCSNIEGCSEIDAASCNPQPCCVDGKDNTSTCAANSKAIISCNYRSQAMCDACQEDIRQELITIPQTLAVSKKNCYDFEKSSYFSSYQLIKNKTDNSLNSFDSSELDKYKIKTLSEYKNDGNVLLNYGNLSAYEPHPNNAVPSYKIENLPIFSHNQVTLIRISNSNFLFGAPPPTSNDSVELYTQNSPTYKNGLHLHVVLCKESSSNSIDCIPSSLTNLNHSTNITELYTDLDPNISTKKNFIKFDQSGNMVRSLNFKDPNNPAQTIANWGNAIKCNIAESLFSNKNWFCFENDLNNEAEINKYKLTFRIKDTDPNPFNNDGEYVVDITSTKFDDDRSAGIVNSILKIITPMFFETKDDPNTQVNEARDGILKYFYISLINHSLFKAILNITIVLSISFFGLGYLMGITEIKHSEIMKILFKIGFIYLFISPSIGWIWYNKFFVQLFRDATDYLSFSVAMIFGNAESINNKILSGDYTDKSVLFASSDRILTMIFSDAIVAKTGALIFSSIFGWVFFVIIGYCFINYIYAIANSILLFITCQIITVLLLVIGPFFFIFLLFKITKDMFDNWIKSLIGFSLQQIFLVLVLSFFNSIIEIFMKNALGYRVCWTDVLKLNIILTTVALFNFWTVAGTNSPTVFSETDPDESFGNDQNMPSLISFVMLYIIIGIMKKFTDFFTNLAVSLSGGLKASTIGADAKAAGGKVLGVAKAMGSKIYSVTAGQLVARADKFLFDSGKIADRQREIQRDKIKGMIQQKASLMKAGNDAVSDYKKKNAVALASMSQAEQSKTLEKVKSDAIKNYASYNGIKNVDEIMNMKGLNYSGTNVIFGAAQAARQAVSKDGALFNSANDKIMKGKDTPNISFSKDEAIQAMKSMNKEEKEEFIKGVESGNIHVNKGRIEQARDIASAVVKSPQTAIKAVFNPINTSKAIAGGVASKASSIGSAIKGQIMDSDLKKEAIKQLESEGNIQKFTDSKAFSGGIAGTIKNSLRSDEDKKLINERMQKIASETRTFNEKPKITSDHVIASLKSKSTQLEDTKKNLGKTELKDGDRSVGADAKELYRKAKNFYNPSSNTESEEKKSKQEKILDQVKLNQEFNQKNLANKKEEITSKGVDVKFPNIEQAVASSHENIKTKLKEVDTALNQKIDDIKKGSAPDEKNFALAHDLAEKIVNREDFKNDRDFMSKIENSDDKKIKNLAKFYNDAKEKNNSNQLSMADEKAQKLAIDRAPSEIKKLNEFKQDLIKADKDISQRVDYIDKAMAKPENNLVEVLDKVKGSNIEEKEGRVKNFIKEATKTVNEYRKNNNILKRAAIASVPFKNAINKTFNKFTDNIKFNKDRKVLSELSGVKDSSSLKKFIDKNSDEINK